MSTATQEREAKITKLVQTTGLNAVRAVARDEARGDSERFKEYFSLGSVRLAEIAPSFDEGLATFNTYVQAHVRWAIRDHKRGASRDRTAERAVGIALRHFSQPFQGHRRSLESLVCASSRRSSPSDPLPFPFSSSSGQRQRDARCWQAARHSDRAEKQGKATRGRSGNGNGNGQSRGEPW